MATKIERLRANLKKEQEKQDQKKLNIIYGYVGAAKTILTKHPFRDHRVDAIKGILSTLEGAEATIEAATEDVSVTGGE